MHAAAAGDDRAWALLFEHFTTTIRLVARRHRLCEADQDEVVQRTWIRLVERITTVREPAAIAGWLITTARRESLGLLAGATREILGADPVEPSQRDDRRSRGRGAARGRRPASARALYRAIDGLPPHQRALMRLLVARPALSYEQVGAALGMPVGSIGPTRGRSLSTLRRNPHLRERRQGGSMNAHLAAAKCRPMTPDELWRPGRPRASRPGWPTRAGARPDPRAAGSPSRCSSPRTIRRRRRRRRTSPGAAVHRDVGFGSRSRCRCSS